VKRQESLTSKVKVPLSLSNQGIAEGAVALPLLDRSKGLAWDEVFFPTDSCLFFPLPMHGLEAENGSRDSSKLKKKGEKRTMETLPVRYPLMEGEGNPSWKPLTHGTPSWNPFLEPRTRTEQKSRSKEVVQGPRTPSRSLNPYP